MIDAPTTLYRFFDAAGQLVYCGITGELPRRLQAHNRQQNWWREVARLTLEHFPTRDAARAAEAQAIRDERPRFNRWSGQRAVPAEVTAAMHAIAEKEQRDWRAGECSHRCVDGCVFRIDALAVEDRLRLDPDSVGCTLLDVARQLETA